MLTPADSLLALSRTSQTLLSAAARPRLLLLRTARLPALSAVGSAATHPLRQSFAQLARQPTLSFRSPFAAPARRSVPSHWVAQRPAFPPSATRLPFNLS
jgi:hypothetical protein